MSIAPQADPHNIFLWDIGWQWWGQQTIEALRSSVTLPMAYPGGTQPIRADPQAVQVPPVVPGPKPDFTNTQPPPIIPVGDIHLPPGGMAEESIEGENQVALEDWLNAGVSIANAWGQQPVSNLWQGPAQYVGTPSAPAAAPVAATAAGALPKGMYYDKHGHLVHRRRRKRPCISQTDLNLAWQVSNLPTNANVKMFLAKCVK